MTDTAAKQARYRSLVVTTCEWRAFGVDDPQAMADRVFARLRERSGAPYLRQLYKAVDDVVAATYQREAAKRSMFDFVGLRGGRAGGAPKSDIDRIGTALRDLPMRDIVLLRQAYWDQLTPDEMAEVNGGTAASQALKCDVALARLKMKLPPEVAGDPAEAMRSIKPGTHWR